jgi:manganese transport protein
LLVLSQVVFSIASSFPMIALVIFTRCAGIMGRFINRATTRAAAVAGTAVVLALNVFHVAQAFDVPLPGRI